MIGLQSTVGLPSLLLLAAAGLGPETVSTAELLSVFYEVRQAAVGRLGHERHLKYCYKTKTPNISIITSNEAKKEVTPNMTSGTWAP